MYNFVFFRKKATGEYIRKPSNLRRVDLDSDKDDKEDREPDINAGDKERELVIKLTTAKKLALDTNPNAIYDQPAGIVLKEPII